MAIVGALLAFLPTSELRQVPPAVLIMLDAAGLSLFAITGLQKAVLKGIGPLGAVLMGLIPAARRIDRFLSGGPPVCY